MPNCVKLLNPGKYSFGLKKILVRIETFPPNLYYNLPICSSSLCSIISIQSVSNMFIEILNTHGPGVRKLASEFVRLSGLEARWANHRIFNLRCLKNNIIPKRLQIKPPDNSERCYRAAQSTSKVFLKQRMYLKHK